MMIEKANSGSSLPAGRQGFFHPLCYRRQVIKSLIIIYFFVLSLAGCATSPTVSKEDYPYRISPGEGLYHRVEKGETLWRIAKLYDVELDNIVKANRIGDATKISQGQMIFIPTSGNTKSALIPERDSSFIWPVKGKVISHYGLKKKNSTVNKGIDILVEGGADVAATRAGKVVFCSDKIKGFGKTIIIQHGESFTSVYTNNDVILVKEGQLVNRGELIAKAGRTERSGDYILHFEIRKGHIPQNPFYFLP